MKEEQNVNERLNIREISRLTNVSTTTVSRVLNGSSRIPDHTREKTLDVMRRTNYTSSVFTQSLKRDSTKTAGITCPNTMDVYVTRAIFNVQKGLSRYNYSSLLNRTGYELEDKKEEVSLLLQKRVDGIMLIGSSFNEVDADDNKYIIEATGQVLIIWTNGTLGAPNIYNAYCDGQEAACRATKRLFSTGMDGKCTIYLYNRESYNSKCKVNGFLTAMIESDQPALGNSITLCPLDRVDQVLDELMKNPEDLSKIEAVTTSGGNPAARVLRHLRRRGLRVPSQIQAIEYSSLGLDNYYTPELTSIDSCVSGLSGETVEMLLKVLGGKTVEENKVLKTRIILRESAKELYNGIQGDMIQ